MTEKLKKLNKGSAGERIETLEKLLKNEKEKPPIFPQYVNNHIHTNFSFSPYSPTAAVYFARKAGLQTAGLMDHDSIAGAYEFIKAGEIAGMATTIGLECRVSLKGTALEGRRVNNPDQISCAYMALHGLPHTQIEYLQSVFAPLREKRNHRNIKMLKNINELLAPKGLALDFEKDVLPLSNFKLGGSVTERHLLFALAKKIEAKLGKNKIAHFLQNELSLSLNPKQIEDLKDINHPFYSYKLLGVLKADLVEKFYLDADEELLHISDLAQLAKETGAIFCYAYLGDVFESVTGDKKAQKFEDDYLDLLFDVLKAQGVKAVTYMPSRNTAAQLKRLQEMCRNRGFMEISGEDINSPGQSFICEQLAQPQFSHLVKATWQLIKHEKEETLRQLNAIN
ncbi:MAG: PHP domain-containing protein [Clostridiales bacterium]|nr:PHP domain-containing protein [Clostridiales bacterium]